MLGGIIDLISDIGLGDRESQSKDMLGKVFIIHKEIYTMKLNNL